MMRRVRVVRHKLIGMVAVLGLCGALAVCASAPASADTVIGTCTIVSNPTPTTFTNCPGANLTGPVNLTGFDLSYANLSGADAQIVSAPHSPSTATIPISF